MKGHYQKPNTWNWKKTVLVVLAVIIGLLAALIVGVVIYYNSMLNKMNQVKVPTIEYTEEATEATQAPTETSETTETTEATTEATEPHIPSSADYINFLVVGQAAREGEPEFFADTMLLFTLNTYEKTLTQTSILRDSFVQYPNYTDTNGKAHHGGRIKLTTIYHMGYLCTNTKADAMGLMNLTLYKNFGIEVDHNFEIDFDGFVDIINMLGGVDIELTQAEADYLNKYITYEGCIPDKYEVKEGMNHLEGYAALTYARLRKAEGDSESDIKRTSRQQKMVSILLEKIRGLSLPELQNLANKVLPLITTSMDNAQITEYLLNYLPMLPELKLQSGGTCPAESWGDLVDIYGDGMQHSVLRFDENATKKAMRAITEGEVE